MRRASLTDQPVRRPKVYPSLAERRVHYVHNYTPLYPARAPRVARLHSMPRGMCPDRIASCVSVRELAFAAAWERENDTRPYARGGRPSATSTLRLLMAPEYMQAGHHFPSVRAPKVTNRDRRVAATVVQWLGSNIGFSFLERTLRDIGFELVKHRGTGIAIDRPYARDASGRTGPPPVRPRDVRRRMIRRLFPARAFYPYKSWKDDGI